MAAAGGADERADLVAQSIETLNRFLRQAKCHNKEKCIGGQDYKLYRIASCGDFFCNECADYIYSTSRQCPSCYILVEPREKRPEIWMNEKIEESTMLRDHLVAALRADQMAAELEEITLDEPTRDADEYAEEMMPEPQPNEFDLTAPVEAEGPSQHQQMDISVSEHVGSSQTLFDDVPPMTQRDDLVMNLQEVTNMNVELDREASPVEKTGQNTDDGEKEGNQEEQRDKPNIPPKPLEHVADVPSVAVVAPESPSSSGQQEAALDANAAAGVSPQCSQSFEGEINLFSQVPPMTQPLSFSPGPILSPEPPEPLDTSGANEQQMIPNEADEAMEEQPQTPAAAVSPAGSNQQVSPAQPLSSSSPIQQRVVNIGSDDDEEGSFELGPFLCNGGGPTPMAKPDNTYSIKEKRWKEEDRQAETKADGSYVGPKAVTQRDRKSLSLQAMQKGEIVVVPKKSTRQKAVVDLLAKDSTVMADTNSVGRVTRSSKRQSAPAKSAATEKKPNPRKKRHTLAVENQMNKSTRQQSAEKRNRSGETLLHQACADGDLETVKKLLSSGQSTNVLDNNHWTPLHEAVKRGDLGMTRSLFEHHALIDVPGGESDRTALFDAVEAENAPMVQLLRRFGADKERKDNFGETPESFAKGQKPLVLEALDTEAEESNDALAQVEREYNARPTKIYLSSSAVAEFGAKVGEKMCKELDLEVVDDIRKSTHMIVKLNGDDSVVRSFEVLKAVLCGTHLIGTEWLIKAANDPGLSSDEFEALNIVTPDPNPQIISENIFAVARAARAQMNRGLLRGCWFFLPKGDWKNVKEGGSIPTKKEMEDLIRLGDGGIINRAPNARFVDNEKEYTSVPAYGGDVLPAQSNIFVVGVPGVEKPWKPKGKQSEKLISVSATWLLETIAQYKFVKLF